MNNVLEGLLVPKTDCFNFNSRNKIPCPHGFNREFFQILKEELN